MSWFDWFKKRSQKGASKPSDAFPTAKLIDAWRRIVIGEHKSWVLFRHGTCVILMHPEEDLRTQAVELLREWGPVHAGSPAGDFSTLRLAEYPGWVVTCHHNDILTYVSPDEPLPDKQDDLTIGLFGRSKRNQDALALEVIHVEDKHNVA